MTSIANGENGLSVRTKLNNVLERYDQDGFANVAALLADTTLTYSTASAGDIVRTRSEGFSYQVAASGATNQHVTTAGGVKLYVLPGDTGYNVKAFGAVGNGVADDTAAVISCFAVANALKRTGATSSIYHSGATVAFDGVFNLATLSSAIPVECNVLNSGARVVLPSAYAGGAFRLGLLVSGDFLDGANISLPEITRGAAAPAGSIGVIFGNLNASTVHLSRIEHCETVHRCRAVGQGTVYNTIYGGKSSSAKVVWDLAPDTGGWFNANTIIGGSYFIPGVKVSGAAFVKGRVATGGNEIYGNVWLQPSFEGQGSEYLIDLQNAIQNRFVEPYIESGAPLISCSVSGANITKASHGLSVGDAVTFLATSLPSGMNDSVIYFVTSVTTNTFQVSLNRGGSAITFTSAGSGVGYYPAVVCRWDGGSGSVTYSNQIINRSGPLITPIDHQYVGLSYDNGEQSTTRNVADKYEPDDLPFFRGRNGFDSASITRVSYACFPPTVNPQEKPTLWTMGLSDRGLVGKNTDGTVAGRMWMQSGIVYYEPSNGGVTRTIASTTRTLSGPVTLANTTVPANSEADQTATITGVSEGDHAVVNWISDLPTGIVVSWVRVSAANTIKFRFRNLTGSDIAINGYQFTANVTAQYF